MLCLIMKILTEKKNILRYPDITHFSIVAAYSILTITKCLIKLGGHVTYKIRHYVKSIPTLGMKQVC